MAIKKSDKKETYLEFLRKMNKSIKKLKREQNPKWKRANGLKQYILKLKGNSNEEIKERK